MARIFLTKTFLDPNFLFKFLPKKFFPNFLDPKSFYQNIFCPISIMLPRWVRSQKMFNARQPGYFSLQRQSEQEFVQNIFFRQGSFSNTFCSEDSFSSKPGYFAFIFSVQG